MKLANDDDVYVAEHAEVSPPLNKVFDTAGIKWKQKGPYLVAKQGGIELHAFIGIHKRLMGFDGDKPIIVEI